MELDDVIRRRRMVRRYDPDSQVPMPVVTKLLEYAGRAPSAGFSQGWDFLVLRGPEQLATFWQAGADPSEPADSWLTGLMTAPTLILCLSNKQAYLDRYAEPDKGVTDRAESYWPVPYWDIDTGMAALLMLLGAVDSGLGSCFFGVPAPAHDRVKEAFAIPPERHIVGVVSLGYRQPDRPSPSLKRGRKPTATVAHLGRFGVPLNDEAPGL